MPRQTVVLTLLFIVNVFSILQINITAVKDLLKVYGLESISKNLRFSGAPMVNLYTDLVTTDIIVVNVFIQASCQLLQNCL
jgi:hypothetical protein